MGVATVAHRRFLLRSIARFRVALDAQMQTLEQQEQARKQVQQTQLAHQERTRRRRTVSRLLAFVRVC